MTYSPAGKYIPSVLDPAGLDKIPVTGTSQTGLGWGFDKLKASLEGAGQQIKTGYVPSAYNTIKEIAERGIERPHNLPEAEIQILAAFVLGFNAK